ncbi:MAG: endonuclease domain-containing protein [Candidatus Peregrinibacteria bacterium]
MKQYQTFIFDSHVFDPETGKIELHYSLDDEVYFTETLLLPHPEKPYALSPTPHALHALHLIGGISYYKTCCPKQIEIRSGNLTDEQADFWNTVYTKGLGEFFFRNQIDFRDLIHFPYSPLSPALSPRERVARSDGRGARILVPIGGGKDSTVTVELLKKAGYDITLLRIGHHPLIKQTAEIAGLPLLTVERHLAPELFDLNAQGALNGHVPVTAYLSLLAAVIAELYGFDAVVMSNERSANEGNVEYLGTKINHQWSKSLECERMLRTSLQESGSAVEYFSLLRPLSELKITQIFATLPQYFSVTTSCNANWKILGKKQASRWCGTCPKCAFVFTMLAAFLPQKTLLEVFGENLFDKEQLLPTFRQLLGLEGFKPFECVGTPEETIAAFLLAHERGDLDQSKAMKLFVEHVLPTLKQPKKIIEEALKPSSEHCIPAPFSSLLQ